MSTKTKNPHTTTTTTTTTTVANNASAVTDDDIVWKPDDDDDDDDADNWQRKKLGMIGGGREKTEESSTTTCDDDKKKKEPSGNVIIFERKGNIFHLATILRKYTGAKLTYYRGGYRTGPIHIVKIDKEKLYDALGLLRALQYDVKQYNSTIMDDNNNDKDNTDNDNNDSNNPKLDLSEIKYRRFRLSRQAVTFGVRMNNSNERIIIPGLDSLVEFIVECNYDKIAEAKATVESGMINFDSLLEYFQPGLDFIDHGVGTGITVNTMMRCRACYYSRSKMLFGTVITFWVAMEVIVSTGDCKYAIVESQFMIPSYGGSKSSERSVDFFTIPTTQQINTLKNRGISYQQICGEEQHNNNSSTSSSSSLSNKAGTGIMVEYAPGTFVATSKGSLRGGTSRSGSYGQASRCGGRMIVDTTVAWTRGVNCANSMGVACDSVIETLKSYAQKRAHQQASISHHEPTTTDTTTSSSTLDADSLTETLILNSPLPECLVGLTWPVVPGFSLQARTWGNAMVHGTSHVTFNESAFDALVMSQSRKKLIQALIMSHETKKKHADLIAGKGEGSIFLLHGPPGVGKTLTAEAIAEMLHKPLYVVSMGELGTTPETLEDRLQDVLDLCIPWKALVLIDEAEMLLEARTKNDIVRNSMVCVMLRLLEYYSGILFLTTNRVESLDPAFQSRVTCALRYDPLSVNSRKEIWITMMKRLDILPTTTTTTTTARATTTNEEEDKTSSSGSNNNSNFDLDKLASVNINGRQIKNTLQLAMALAQHDNVPVSQEHLEATLEITTSFLESM